RMSGKTIAVSLAPGNYRESERRDQPSPTTMPNVGARRVLQHIRNLVAAQQDDCASDRDLLERFSKRRDEGAFAALVRRHGPMVLGLCRRILHNEHDAEDAFQATFILLGQKAASLHPHKSLCGWLHCVAYRVAQKAKIAAARRHKHEKR